MQIGAYRRQYVELEEPFSDSEEDDDDGVFAPSRKPVRPRLHLPTARGRVRTLSGTVPPVGYSPLFGGPTMCLKCLEFFDLPKHTEKYVEHLLEKHQIVINDIELIVDVKRYIEHWRHRFEKDSIEKVFPKVAPKEGDLLHGKLEEYLLMTESVKEDRELRERLALRRLEEVLGCQQREREDMTFLAQCLFCRYTARGNRSKIIHHLYMIHHLNLGSPDNLVFVYEYLDCLRAKMDNNICIYCEKQMGDRQILMDHMRKRSHREVNPKNNYYDKFYIINYLELGKRWLEVLAEDFEDSMLTFIDSDDDEEEDAYTEWQEDGAVEEHMVQMVCLVCDHSEENAKPLIDHMKNEHKFDLIALIGDQKMDFYQRIKFINYIRKLSYDAQCFVCGKDDMHSWQALRKHLVEADHIQHFHPKPELWETDDYLAPVFENDHLLWSLESYLEEEQANKAASKTDEKDEKASKTTAETVSTVPEGVDATAELSKCPVEVFPEDLPDLESSELKKDPDLLLSLQ